MLPEAEYKPPRFCEFLVSITVPFHVTQNLFRPIPLVCLWRHVMLRAAVPIASVNEYSHFCGAEDQVSCPAKIRQRTGGYAVSQTLGMHEAAD